MNENFSVLMSIYYKENVDNFENCMRSITAPYQTLPPTEIILIEDGPLPQELKTSIEKWKTKKINLITKSLPSNQGLAKALNTGLNICSYELIARMDTDDIAYPNRFLTQVKFMENNKDISASSCYIHEYNNSMTEIISERILPTSHNDLIIFAKKRSPLSHPGSIFRKSAVSSVNGYPNIYPEDYALWCNLLHKEYKLANIPEYLIGMRTDNDMLARRGWNLFKGEVKIHHQSYQRKKINSFEFIILAASKFILRCAPTSLKRIFYKKIR